MIIRFILLFCLCIKASSIGIHHVSKTINRFLLDFSNQLILQVIVSYWHVISEWFKTRVATERKKEGTSEKQKLLVRKLLRNYAAVYFRSAGTGNNHYYYRTGVEAVSVCLSIKSGGVCRQVEKKGARRS